MIPFFYGQKKIFHVFSGIEGPNMGPLKQPITDRAKGAGILIQGNLKENLLTLPYSFLNKALNLGEVDEVFK